MSSYTTISADKLAGYRPAKSCPDRRPYGGFCRRSRLIRVRQRSHGRRWGRVFRRTATSPACAAETREGTGLRRHLDVSAETLEGGLS